MTTKPVSRPILSCKRKHADHPVLAVAVLLGSNLEALDDAVVKNVKVRGGGLARVGGVQLNASPR